MGIFSKWLKKVKNVQPSTLRGMALLGSVVAAGTGHGSLFSAEMTESGVQMGGVIGVAVPVIVGAYDAIRDEFKGK